MGLPYGNDVDQYDSAFVRAIGAISSLICSAFVIAKAIGYV